MKLSFALAALLASPVFGDDGIHFVGDPNCMPDKILKYLPDDTIVVTESNYVPIPDDKMAQSTITIDESMIPEVFKDYDICIEDLNVYVDIKYPYRTKKECVEFRTRYVLVRYNCRCLKYKRWGGCKKGWYRCDYKTVPQRYCARHRIIDDGGVDDLDVKIKLDDGADTVLETDILDNDCSYNYDGGPRWYDDDTVKELYSDEGLVGFPGFDASNACVDRIRIPKKPAGDLSKFDNNPLTGSWMLDIKDTSRNRDVTVYGGRLNCWALVIIPKECESSSGANGDPHFKTLGHTYFDFHGGCDLVLANFPSFANGLGLTVHLRTTTRYDYSYIEGAAIKIGNDVLEIFSYGQYLLNSVSNAEMPATVGGGNYTVTHTEPRDKQHLFVIDLDQHRSINIKVFKDMLYVDLNVNHGNGLEFEDVSGMIGSWTNGTRFARDGSTIMDDDNEFGQEWQVRPDIDGSLFTTSREPQWPTKCLMPNKNTLEDDGSSTTSTTTHRRRLGETTVTADEASTACAHIQDTQSYDMCVFDVIATGDLAVAAGGAY